MEYGQDGGIANFMGDIEQVVRESSGYVLEIGVATGTGSTVAIQRGLKYHPYPIHVSVDQKDYMAVKPEVDWWHLVIGDDRELDTFNKVANLFRGRHASVIFIDTDHTYEQMSEELKLWKHIANENTVWLFHDTWMFSCFNEGMVKAITEFADANGWVYDDWKTEPHGLGRMRWKGIS